MPKPPSVNQLAVATTRRLLTIALLAIGHLVAPSCSKAPNPPTDESSAARSSPALPTITEFQGNHRFLSNFWPAPIEFEGITYPSVEHAYQAAKSLDPADRKRIAAIADPAEAKRAGRALTQRADWETAKFDVMERCVREKFTRHPDLRAKLIATGNAILEEGNSWGDRVWGVYQGQGENRLGKILMKIRAELRTATR